MEIVSKRVTKKDSEFSIWTFEFWQTDASANFFGHSHTHEVNNANDAVLLNEARHFFYALSTPHKYLSVTSTNTMIPSALRTVARRSTGRQSVAAFHTTSSLSADVSVEHGRGDWKTYGDLSSYKPGSFQIKTYNKISPHGLARFPSGEYEVREG